MTESRTAEDIRQNIRSIELAALGMGQPLNLGQRNRIAALRSELTDTECTTCGATATVHGRLAHFCDACAEAYRQRSARFAKLAPDTHRRLVNGSK